MPIKGGAVCVGGRWRHPGCHMFRRHIDPLGNKEQNLNQRPCFQVDLPQACPLSFSQKRVQRIGRDIKRTTIGIQMKTRVKAAQSASPSGIVPMRNIACFCLRVTTQPLVLSPRYSKPAFADSTAAAATPAPWGTGSVSFSSRSSLKNAMSLRSCNLCRAWMPD